MKNIMIILKHNLKSVMKNWFWLILAFPIAMNLFLNIFIEKVHNVDDDTNSVFDLAIFTKDNSEIVDRILPKDKFGTLYVVNQKKEIKELLDNGKISVGVIIDSNDIYEDLKNEKDGAIEVVSQSEYGKKEYVLSIINTGIMQVTSFGDSKEEVLKAFDEYEDNKYTFDYENSKLEDIIGYITVFGLFSMAFLFIAGRGIIPLLKERELRIDRRILASKISRVEYALGHILGCFILLLFQSITLLGTFYLMNKDFNINLGWMILLSFALSFVGIAIALIVLSVSNNSAMYYSVLSVVVTPMCLLSGGFVPTNFMPEMVQNFSLIFPLTWINSAYKKILMNGSYVSIGMDLLASVAISSVLIMLYLVIEHRRKNRFNY